MSKGRDIFASLQTLFCLWRGWILPGLDWDGRWTKGRRKSRVGEM
jgi:hypothetical protein